MTWEIAADGNVITVKTPDQEISRYDAVTFSDEGVMGERCTCERVPSADLGDTGHAIVSEVRRADPASRLYISRKGFKVRVSSGGDVDEMIETVHRLQERHSTRVPVGAR